MATDPWAAFPNAEPQTPRKAPVAPAGDPWAAFPDAKPAAPAAPIGGPPVRPTGRVYDGDTFGVSSRGNARLYGVDAFELAQTGRDRSGASVPLGQQARSALAPFTLPGGVVSPTGAMTYGRPVASLASDGRDAGQSILDQGFGIATPEYLKADPDRLSAYMEAERLARLNRRGAWSTAFDQPGTFRDGRPDPWAKPVAGKEGESQAVFWDEPMPFQGMRPDIAEKWIALHKDTATTAEAIEGFAVANGFKIDPASARRFIAERDAKPGATISDEVIYGKAPRLLTDPGDGKFGTFMRGVGDPLNIIDEAGALVDTFGGTAGRENLWDSDRRFGDVYANNLDQNRSILANDEATAPWTRLGGQLISGMAIPGASVRGVGIGAARTALREGGTRMVAEAAGEAAVRNRLMTAGALEGAAIGAGSGEDLGSRATGAVTGGVIGGVLGTAIGVAGKPVIDFTKQTLAPGVRRIVRGRAGLDPASGQFGPIHYDLASDYPAALARLQADGSGEVPGAIKHPDVGDIDLVWGTSNYGLKHIAEKHPEVIADLPNIVSRLPVKQRPDEVGNNRFVLEDDMHRAVVSPDFDGVTKRWLVSAFELKGRAPGDQTSRRDPLMPDGGSTGSGTIDNLGDAAASGNGARIDPASGAIMGGTDPLRSVDRIDVTGRAVPLLDPAPDALRRTQAQDMVPGGILPLPANTVNSLDEAERITAGRIIPVRAPNEADALERRTIPSATTGTPLPKRGPLDLVTWLRTQGGIRAQGGELERSGIDNTARKGVDFAGGENRFGPLISNDGMGYDDAAQRAWEAGFFPDSVERPTVAEFLDRLAATHSGGNRAFRPDDLPEVDAFEAARAQRFEVEAAQQEGRPLYQDRGEPVGYDDLDNNTPPMRAYEEWGETPPNLAGNIRLDRLDSPQSIARALTATEARVGGFDAATRGRITQAETANLAADLGMTADDLLTRRKGQAFNAEQALAARQILARSATDLVNMARRIKTVDNPGDELEAGFKEAWLRHVAIQEQVAGATAEAGRVLAQFRMVADSRAVGRVLPTLGDIAGGSARLRDAANMIVDSAADPALLNTTAARALKPRFRDKLIEVYYNSLLSGPQTHAVNILSNTITALTQIPEHAVAAGVGAVRKALPGQSDTDRVLFSELGARTVGLLQGVREGLRQAGRTFVTGEPIDAVTKIEQQTQRAVSGVKGSILRTPTRALMAEDELFKAMARRMELTGLATREAYKEGLKGPAATRRIADILANPSDEMLAQSFDYGRYLTFQNPLGDFGQLVSRATETLPALKLILPFVRTPTNILKFAIERSPAAPLLKEWRADIAAGGPKRDLALAKVLTGSGIAAYVVQLAQEGKITGGGPADPSARRLLEADGWQPYSFKVGDQYLSYHRLDPYSTVIGTAADLVDRQSYMTEKQQENAALRVGAAVLENLSNKTWLSGLSDALEALSDSERRLEGFSARLAGSLAVPAVVAQVARVTDPMQREARSPIDRIKSRIPYLSQTLPVRRDVLGGPLINKGGLGPDLVTPIYTSTDRKDALAEQMLESRVSIGRPTRGEISPADYDRYQEAAGSNLRRDLGPIIGGPVWAQSSQEERQDFAADVIRRSRKEAREQLGVSPSKKKVPGGVPVVDPWAAFPDAR